MLMKRSAERHSLEGLSRTRYGDRLRGLADLEAHHVRGLSDFDRNISIRRCAGTTVAEIAGDLFVSQGTVKRALSRLQDSIFVPLAIARDSWLTGYWIANHLECCVLAPDLKVDPQDGLELALLHAPDLDTPARR